MRSLCAGLHLAGRPGSLALASASLIAFEPAALPATRAWPLPGNWMNPSTPAMTDLGVPSR